MTSTTDTSSHEIAILQPKTQVLNFADALSLAGNEHKYQKRIVLVMSLQRICFGFLFTAFPFLFQQPEFQCRDSYENDFYSCEPTPETCSLDIMPVPGSYNSLITYFGLYCDGAKHADLIKTLFTAACSIGVMVIFPLADKLGRRPGLIASYTVGAISLFLLAFAKTWQNFAVFLALAGLGLSPYLANSFLILNEFSGSKMRANASVIINLFWTFGQIAVVILAYLLSNDWSSLVLLGLGLPLTVLLPLTILWTKESPMFLISHRKYTEAKEVLKTVAQTNKRELKDFEFTEEKKERSQNATMEPKKKYGFPDLFKYRALRKTTLLGAFLCFAFYFNYYGTIFALDSVKVNSYVLTIVLAIAELVAYYVSGVMTQKISRRLAFALCSIVSFSANILFAFFPVPENFDETPYQVYVQLILSTINRFAVSIATAIMGIYINEIFPTSIRAIGSGLIMFIGRLGSFVATIAISVCMSIGVNPILVFGAICLPATVVSFMIKETQGLPLPETIEEEACDSKRYIKSFEFSSLYKTIQRKLSQSTNKEALLKLNESFESDTTASSPKRKSQDNIEIELSL